MRWDASGTAATELGNLGTDGNGLTTSYAYAVNTAGTALGVAEKYESGVFMGQRAVRWDASGTAATELGHLGTNRSGNTFSQRHRHQRRRHGGGYAQKYVDGHYLEGHRAVRWDASGTRHRAGDPRRRQRPRHFIRNSLANAINTAGIAVGYGDEMTPLARFLATGRWRGTRTAWQST